MSIIIWLITGALAGWIASKLTDTDESMGLTENIVVGMIGSLIGGFLVTLLANGDGDLTTAFTGFNLTSIIVSIFGASLFILILRAIRR